LSPLACSRIWGNLFFFLLESVAIISLGGIAGIPDPDRQEQKLSSIHVCNISRAS
jgi:hypothetical protein